MPALDLKTNVAVADPKAFTLAFSKFAAETLKKPESYISVNYTHTDNLTFNGSHEPALLLHITSLDNISPTQNEEYSKAFFAFFKEQLGVPDNRGYITFYDPGRAYLGYKSTTFGVLFG
ncbi:Tautomerase/MIF [Trametes elegans]|nr:Tautomerase/MIF [Trametes elegans]